MNVRRLIAALQKLDPDADVRVDSGATAFEIVAVYQIVDKEARASEGAWIDIEEVEE